MRFFGRRLRVRNGLTGLIPGFALVQAGCMPCLTYVCRAPEAIDGSDNGVEREMSGPIGNIQADTMRSVTQAKTNGKIQRLSPERLAELRVPATATTPEEKQAALKRATEGLRVNVRVTRDMYRPR
jgi:hypothetical protein